MSSISDVFGSLYGADKSPAASAVSTKKQKEKTGSTSVKKDPSAGKDAYVPSSEDPLQKALGGKDASKYSDRVGEVSSKTGKTGEKTDKSHGQKVAVSGRTIGEPKLSKQAADYFEALKKKFGDMDFILVSEDRKQEAAANAGAYGTAGKTVVLIDEAKIEKMATDEKFRSQYESIIANGQKKLSDFSDKLSASGLASSVLGFGMTVKDNGTVGFFAACEKSYAAQLDRQAKRSAEKKAAAKKAAKEAKEDRAEKKAAEKKADKAAAEKKAKEAAAEAKAEKGTGSSESDAAKAAGETEEDSGEVRPAYDRSDVITVRADSIEALLGRLTDMGFARTTGAGTAAAEAGSGTNIDFSM